MNSFWKLSIGMFAIVAFTGCSDEKDIPGLPTAKNDETRYLRISIASNSENVSRIDYESGTADESAVNTLDFYFYDAGRKYVSHIHVDDPVNGKDAGAVSGVEKIMTSVVPVELVQGATIPSYVVVAVNAINPSQHRNRSLDEVQAQLLSSVEEKGFGMSNSVYYGSDKVNNTGQTLIVATPFDSKVLKTKSEMDAIIVAAGKEGASEEEKEALRSITVDCYVERYASKITLSGVDYKDVIPVTDYVTGGVTLRFVPEGWAFNNFEKNFYFLKSYGVKGDDGYPVGFESFSELSAGLSWNWNDEAGFRSHWSRTPGYFSKNYPRVADDILDNIKGKYDPSKEIASYPFDTYYQTYSYFSQENGSKIAIGHSGYFSETTVGKDVITGEGMPDQYNRLAAIPSVIVVGHYDVIVGGQTVSTGEGSPTFYTYGTSGTGKDERMVVYSAETDKGGTAIDGVPSLLDRMLKNQKVVYFKDENGKAVYDLTEYENARNEFSIEHPVKDSRSNLRIASRIVTLQHNNTNNPALYFHDPENPKTDIKLNSADAIARANRLLFESLGGASAFTQGRAFFSAPIQHLGWQRDENGNRNKPQDQWNWNEMEAGDFGVVRNHTYSILVKGISGLGIGIRDYDTPILTPSENVTYDMSFSVRVQKWAIVPSQTIEW